MINQTTIGTGLIENDFLRQFATGYTRSKKQINGLLESDADMVLERARWAAEVFQRYDRNATMAIADAVPHILASLE